MQWASAVSPDSSIEAAIDDAAGRVTGALDREADLVVAFVSSHHEDGYERLPALVAKHFPNALLVGCSAGGVIGGGHEIEREPGLSLTAAAMPGVRLLPFAAATDEDPVAASPLAAVAAVERPHFVLLADPFSFETERFLGRLDGAFPESRKIGGLASGGSAPGSNALWLGERTLRGGLVGIAMTGDVEVDTIVAQGCRPIGEPGFVTACRRNLLLALDGRPPLEVLRALYQTLPPADQELFRHSLFLGIVMNERQERYRQGEFLIRNVVGADDSSGAIGVGAILREGLVVQFHLRDARTSAEDLEALLSAHRAPPPAGSLLFSCLGRGRFLYGRPDHDPEAFQRHLGDVPLGGFFCNGEIGPVGGTTFLHGYTSSFALFRPRE